MDKFTSYPYAYIHKGKKRILVWQSNEDGHDNFKIDDNNLLISAVTKIELNKLLGTQAENLNWEYYNEINFDKFLNSLKNLKSGTYSKEVTCNTLIEGWNFIEDLAYTLGLDQELDKLNSPTMKKVYNKCFFGNNLPSITPERKSYNPIWREEEIILFRKEIRSIWKKLKAKLTER